MQYTIFVNIGYLSINKMQLLLSYILISYHAFAQFIENSSNVLLKNDLLLIGVL